MTETYYDLLGVAPDATAEEIERAYRERLKETHPDVNDAPDARERTRRLLEAREVLTDEDERARYERLGHTRYTGADEADAGEGSPGRDPAADDGGYEADTGEWSDRTAGSGDATATDGAGTTADGAPGAGVGGRRRSRRSSREHVGTPSWSGHREAAAGDARAWNPDAAYAVRRSEHPRGLDRTALAVLAVTFLAYPVLVGGALFPGFPLALNALVGGCALGVVAYLQSVPAAGLIVFGAWLLLGPALLFALGLPVVSALGAAAVLAAALPLGLSGLTYLALG